MDTGDVVRDHYSRDDLTGTVLAVLRSRGVDPDALRMEDLGGLDQLHAGSVPATEHVLEVLQLDPGTHLIEVGCGIGGAARLAAHRYGCEVHGIDLSADFVELGRDLTRRVGLADRVRLEVGSATDLPFEDGTFSRAMMNHVGMNIADKAAVFADVRRVLDAGALFAVYEQMRVGDGELTYPMPWAQDETSSFVERRGRYAELLGAAGFEVVRDEDRTAEVAGAQPPPGALTPADLFGEGFEERITNNIVATMSGSLAPVLMVARAV